MRKAVVLVAAVLLLAGLGAAVDRHGPMKTGMFEVQIDDVEMKGWQSVTIPGKSVEQDSYREGNDASHEKKLRGKPSFDDLEMERGVKPGATELHDWFEDVRAGTADEGRKEIAVKLLNEEGGKTVGAGKITVIVELAGNEQDDGFTVIIAIKDNESGEEYFVHATGEIRDDDEVTFDLREARKGRNPQTGKEIKIPANAGGGDDAFRETLDALLVAALHDKKTTKFKPGAELSEKIKDK